MLVGAKVCDLAEDLLWFVCGLYVGILMSSLSLCSRFYLALILQSWHDHSRIHSYSLQETTLFLSLVSVNST